MSSSPSNRTASALGISGVVLGAFGAHLLKSRLMLSGTLEIWQTAVLYHLLHAVAFLSLAIWPVSSNERQARFFRRARLSWLIGILLFSGSLYALALGAPRWVGPITPIGGLALILGWLWVGLAGKSTEDARKS